MAKEQTEIELQLLQITRQFLVELRIEHAVRALSLDSLLEKELGLGSLERAELFHRIERGFNIVLPSQILAQASVLRDFTQIIKQTHPFIQSSTKPVFTSSVEYSQVNPLKAERLPEVLMQYAESEPKRPHIYLQDEHGVEQMITYGELFEKASQIATTLLNQKLKPGDTVAIMLPTSSEFFSVFFGILLAGAIPAPIYPLVRLDRIEEYVYRQTKILQNAEISLLISFSQAQLINRLLKPFVSSLRKVLNVSDLLNDLPQNFAPVFNSHNSALIQYTSGSTGDPKGVLLSHGNLLANIRAIGKALQIKPSDVIVSWLPLYHDMGLIGAWLSSLYHGIPLTILSPLTFLSRPERWLWAIHYHRGTISASPNFGYELCINKIDENLIEGLDLSTWRLALNGAETVHEATVTKFSKKFAQYRFKPTAMLPVYGLAESSVGLIFPPINQLPVIDYINRQVFIEQNKAVPIEHSDSLAVPMVCCGQALPEHAVRIVDENDHPLPERMVGALQFQGPSSMVGYYRNSEATQAIYHDGWWDSGDLAYQAQGQIYIAGRKKDIILTAGRTFYPQEIEVIGERIPGVRKGCVIAFGVHDSELGTERCVIVAETAEQDETARQKIIDKFKLAVATTLDMTPHQVILMPPRSLPKTSSGKLQRSACKAAYLQKRLTFSQLPAWMQLVKLLLISGALKLRNAITQLGKIFYTGYCWSMILLTLIPVWLLILPCSTKTSYSLSRFWAKLILKLMFCRLTVEGDCQQIKQQTVIIVSNHSSYIDAVVLFASLPLDAAFIAKKELLKVPVLRTFIKKLKCVLVDRMDFAHSIENTARIQRALEQGRSILIFPEGTFTYATGLRAFKLGAFKLAVDMRIPLCPLGLQGTRRILRGDGKLFSPGPITTKIGPIILPEKADWKEAGRLREAARQQIAHLCGEAPIDLISAGLTGR